jgi:hypothetical protein
MLLEKDRAHACALTGAVHNGPLSLAASFLDSAPTQPPPPWTPSYKALSFLVPHTFFFLSLESTPHPTALGPTSSALSKCRLLQEGSLPSGMLTASH